MKHPSCGPEGLEWARDGRRPSSGFREHGFDYFGSPLTVRADMVNYAMRTIQVSKLKERLSCAEGAMLEDAWEHRGRNLPPPAIAKSGDGPFLVSRLAVFREDHADQVMQGFMGKHVDEDLTPRDGRWKSSDLPEMDHGCTAVLP